jgi:hypothetical protein
MSKRQQHLRFLWNENTKIAFKLDNEKKIKRRKPQTIGEEKKRIKKKKIGEEKGGKNNQMKERKGTNINL